MNPQARPVRVKLSAGQVRRVRQAATVGTIATAAEVAARVAAASVLDTAGRDGTTRSVRAAFEGHVAESGG